MRTKLRLPVSRIRSNTLRRTAIVLTLPLMLLSCPLFGLWNAAVELVYTVPLVLGRLARIAWELLRTPVMMHGVLTSARDSW